MRHLTTSIAVTFVLLTCEIAVKAQPGGGNTQTVYKAVITEVLPTSNYTYLHVLVEGSLKWLAVPVKEFKTGDTCFYRGGLVMPDFASKELKKTFDKVIFLEGVSTTREGAVKPGLVVPDHTAKAKQGKLAISVERAEGGITIGELFHNKKTYAGKIVKIKGQVTRFKSGIMGKNWVHVQDGTSFGDKFDLTATIHDTLVVGSTVTLESKVTTDKDFGSGYFFEIILEDAIVK
ncbi:MAG: hypothetical protein ACOYNC_06765 [Bacteroidales bacterium]